jgi:hypothetical protein
MRIASLVAVLCLVLVGCAGGSKGDGTTGAPTSIQIVRQFVELKSPGNLTSPGGVRVNCNADFVLHANATNNNSGGQMGYVLISPITISGGLSDQVMFQVPGTSSAISLGSTAG